MKDQLSCSKCGRQHTESDSHCSRWTHREIRIRRLGFVRIILGFLLVAMMGTLTVKLTPMFLSAGQRIGKSRFTGTPEQGIMILGLFGIIIVFGFTSMGAGLFQIITRRRNIWITIFTFVLAFFILGLGYTWILR